MILKLYIVVCTTAYSRRFSAAVSGGGMRLKQITCVNSANTGSLADLRKSDNKASCLKTKPQSQTHPFKEPSSNH